jgi:nicotinic acid mononucleotide adenylyltransferase
LTFNRISKENYSALLDKKSKLKNITLYPDGQVKTNYVNDFYLNLYCGSFNPLHLAHKGIYFQSNQKHRSVFFEVSVSRVGKPVYSFNEINKIADQFTWYAPIIITNAPTFEDKINTLAHKNLHRINFICGMDTFKRALEWYKEDFVKLPCDFEVFEREGEHPPEIPQELLTNVSFVELVEEFKPYSHMSSTEIRKKYSS